ncbi:DUF4303 domain-containing protein [Nocardia vaccinii]|uniref:DUF4303 domain-containing protein n=1 Tax=Nocardia vaccinii TaxID=1822 RepID=UPI0014716365|nr:DUF4303 domain-containing protein [Nocardia vaccinii]
MDWNAFEAAWCDSGCHSLADLAAAHPGERLYAAAFHLFYSDGSQILPPALAANTEAAVHQNNGYSTRFVPPEWRWDVLDAAVDPMRLWYQRLSEEFLTVSTDAARYAAGEALEAAHDRAMTRVCKAMTATARRGGIHDSLPANFVVVMLEGQRGEEEAGLIRASVDPRVLATVPELVEHLGDFKGA